MDRQGIRQDRTGALVSIREIPVPIPGSVKSARDRMLEFSEKAKALGYPLHAGRFRETARLLVECGAAAARAHLAKMDFHNPVLFADKRASVALLDGIMQNRPRDANFLANAAAALAHGKRYGTALILCSNEGFGAAIKSVNELMGWRAKPSVTYVSGRGETKYSTVILIRDTPGTRKAALARAVGEACALVPLDTVEAKPAPMAEPTLFQ